MDDEAIFTLPDLGEGLHEAEIVAWLVGPGDHVVNDQPLVSVETDKAVFDVPAPHAGRIAQTFGAPGDRVPVGAPLVRFESEGASHEPAAIVGELPVAPAPTAESSRPAVPPSPSGRVHAAPAVRALATRLGVDLSTVEATGAEGEVLTDDVERAASVPALEPLRSIRRAMARNMSMSGAAVVPATVLDEVDIEDWPPGTDVTTRLVRAVVAGCRAAPALNAWFESHAESRRLHSRVDLGIAVEAEEGLSVPVLRDAGALDAAAVRNGVETLERAVRSRTVTPDQLRAPTITLSNFGMIAGRHAALVVVPPQVAILGAGRIEPRVVAVAGQPAVRRVLPLSLSFDHRVVTGGEAATFLAAVIDDLKRADGDTR